MKTKVIEDYLDYLFPNPECELIYHTDYELLIAVVLSAQSTDKRVNTVMPIILDKYPTLNDLKEADLSDLETIVRPVGSQHKKAAYIKNIATILVDKYNSIVPRDRDKLIELSGVGRKTANVFLSEYYNEPAIAVDTHVERVSKRLGLANKNDDVLKIENKLMKKFSKDKWAKLHLQLVLFGRYHCKAIKPECSNCRLIDICKEKKKNI
ncbi:MAG: endonuclease III [Bacilli bacterium]|nr:endonuclease III [Bacilli bacterium]